MCYYRQKVIINNIYSQSIPKKIYNLNTLKLNGQSLSHSTPSRTHDRKNLTDDTENFKFIELRNHNGLGNAAKNSRNQLTTPQHNSGGKYKKLRPSAFISR